MGSESGLCAEHGSIICYLKVSSPLLLTYHLQLTRSRVQRPAIGEFRMTSFDDMERTILRNMLLGGWAAEKLGITGRDADAYSDALARGTRDPTRSDVFSRAATCLA